MGTRSSVGDTGSTSILLTTFSAPSIRLTTFFGRTLKSRTRHLPEESNNGPVHRES